jgi:HK97 family phage major capsid protein
MTLNAKKEMLVDLQNKASVLNAAGANEGRDLTAVEKSEFNAVMNEFDGLLAEVKDDEKRAAFLAQSKDYMTGLPAKQTERTESKGITMENVFMKLRSSRLPNEFRDMSMGEPTAGGYLMPEQFMPGLKMIGAEPAIVRSRATVIPAGTPPDAKINIPVLNQGTNGEFGGVTVTWIA